jgi:hypothetical protein
MTEKKRKKQQPKTGVLPNPLSSALVLPKAASTSKTEDSFITL